MKFVMIQKKDGIATLMLSRGKVNALNGIVIDELRSVLKSMECDVEVRSIVLTGLGKFFSFGFDVQEFLSFKKEEFSGYLADFADFYTYLFLYPKPIVAALNGHAIGGGCMLALACDHRVMASGKAKISLNEISFGSSVFAGSVEMLRFWAGSANATQVLYSGAMYSAEEARNLGLVQGVTTVDDNIEVATRVASDLALKRQPAFAGLKSLLRKPIAEEMMRREGQSIKEFVEIWYSEATMADLQNIKIY
jgi:enoyl-CoA hydratase/carnithine racemase